MKVCMLTTSYPRTRGDYAGNFVHNLAKGLVEKGIKVSVVAPHDVDTKEHEFIDGVEIYRFQYWFTKKGQKVAYGAGIPDNLKNSFLARIQLPLFLLFFSLKSLRVVRNCDIIHAHWILSGFAAIFPKKMYEKPILLRVRGSGVRACEKPIVMGIRGSRLRKMHRKASKFVLDNSDIISSNQPELIEILRSMGIGDIADIPTMIDYDKFDSRQNSTKFKKEFEIKNESIVVLIARLIEFKDPLTFVRSIPLVIEKDKNARFIMVGDGPLRNKIKETINEMGIWKYVILTGIRSDVDAILNASTIFVTLSRIENIWSSAIVEAVYSRVPCILTKAGYTNKVFTHKKNAYLIEPGSEKELSDAIIYLLENKEIRERLTKNAVTLLNEKGFPKETIIERTIEAYNKLLMRKNVRFTEAWEEIK